MKAFERLVCGTSVVLSLTCAAQAQMTDMSKFTCRELLSATPDAVEAAIWLSGYYNGLRKNTMLNFSSFKQNAAAVIDECKGDPKKTVMQTVNVLLSRKK